MGSPTLEQLNSQVSRVVIACQDLGDATRYAAEATRIRDFFVKDGLLHASVVAYARAFTESRKDGHSIVPLKSKLVLRELGCFLSCAARLRHGPSQRARCALGRGSQCPHGCVIQPRRTLHRDGTTTCQSVARRCSTDARTRGEGASGGLGLPSFTDQRPPCADHLTAVGADIRAREARRRPHTMERHGPAWPPPRILSELSQHHLKL